MKQSTGLFNQALSVWYNYKAFVQRRTSDKRADLPLNMDDWRSKLFTNFITYLLPSCLVALVPGAYMSFNNGYIAIGTIDILAAILTAVVALTGGIPQHIKKVMVIGILYLLSVMLLVNLSIYGPGFVYLLTLTVVVTLTCKMRLAYLSVAMNFAVCGACALIIHYKFWDTAITIDYPLGLWIAVSSNIVFLSFIIVVLIGKSIQGLEKTIAQELSLKTDLHRINLQQLSKNQMLKESEAHYRSLFFQSPTPMLILDVHTLKFLQVNLAAIQKYGYTKHEFLGMKLTDIKMNADSDIINADITEGRQFNPVQTSYSEHIKKNGEIFHVEVAFNAIPFNGKPATLAISNDLTERMAYLASIQLQNEKLRQIAWIQSHQVRSPLSSILGLSQLYDKQLPSNEVAELMEKIKEAASKLDFVIHETINRSTT